MSDPLEGKAMRARDAVEFAAAVGSAVADVVDPQHLAAELAALRSERDRYREALTDAQAFTSEVAGDDCPHAVRAELLLHRIAAALAGSEDETTEGGEG